MAPKDSVDGLREEKFTYSQRGLGPVPTAPSQLLCGHLSVYGSNAAIIMLDQSHKASGICSTLRSRLEV
jgi:hypothetical protein